MVDIRKQNDVIQINVSSEVQGGSIKPTNDSSAYYSSLAMAWASKMDGSVDGIEYSSKYYASKAKESADASNSAKNGILNNSAFQIVSSDLSGDNNIGLCAENIDSIQNAASNAQIAADNALVAINQAELAAQKAQEAASSLSEVAKNDFSNITDAAKEVIKENSSGGLEIGDIGISLYVDESKGLRRRLNGSTIAVNTNTQEFVNYLKSVAALYPSLSCTETEWAELEDASDVGQVGKFVIQDTEEIPYYAYSSDSTVYYTKSTEDAESVEVYDSEFTLQGQGSISQGVLTYNSSVYNRASESDITQEISGYVRLPKIIMPIQGLSDLTKLGEYSQAGLPNITGRFCNWAQNGRGVVQEGALFGNGTTGAGGQSSGSNNTILNLDASRSSAIYGKSTTVQQEQIQYPYFIQIATGQETEANITNEIELNNPFTLFDSKYSEVPLYNVSWLKADGEYKSKSLYITVYEALVVENNSEVNEGDSVTLPSGTTYVKRGLSVKLSTAEDITDYDFVINTTEETFRLPLKNGMEGMFSGQAVVGNGMALGLNNGSVNMGLLNGGATGIYGTVLGYDVPIGTSCGGTPSLGVTDKAIGVTSDPTKSGLVVSGAGEVPDGWSLYYYVGETVQNVNLINAGRFDELVSAKVNVDLSNCTRPYVTETYVNGTSWYRVWSDGWIEQGGVSAYSSVNRNVTLMKSYSTTNYHCLVSQRNVNNGSGNIGGLPASVNAITLRANSDESPIAWYTFGY